MRHILFALALLSGACFDPDEPPCTFACGENGACPDNYECQADGYCHLKGHTGPCNYSDAAVAPADLSVPDLAEDDMSIPEGDMSMTPDVDMSTTPEGDMSMMPDVDMSMTD